MCIRKLCKCLGAPALDDDIALPPSIYTLLFGLRFRVRPTSEVRWKYTEPFSQLKMRFVNTLCACGSFANKWRRGMVARLRMADRFKFVTTSVTDSPSHAEISDVNYWRDHPRFYLRYRKIQCLLDKAVRRSNVDQHCLLARTFPFLTASLPCTHQRANPLTQSDLFGYNFRRLCLDNSGDTIQCGFC
jgi:hypothetical protein